MTGAINAGGRVVHLVIHPVLGVARGADGRLGELLDDSAAGLRESWMQIEITREADPAGLARLAETLAAVLVDVRAVVQDWQPMRRVLHALLDELSLAPAPPVPPAELAEVQEFLRWLDDDNLTFLGFREYDFEGAAEPAQPALGILRDPEYPIFGGLRNLSALPADVQDFVRRRALVVISKSNRRATVHRSAHMDAIGLRRFGADGAVVGIRLFLGLFTSNAYSRNPSAIPLLRQKVRYIVERTGLSPSSHDGRALLHILDTLPRDELFQADQDQLFDTVTGILDLQERQRIALFVRRDPLERFVSCLVYVPRERYDTQLRQRFAAILEEAFAGRLSAFFTHLDDSVLARVQFIIRTRRGAVGAADAALVERQLAEAGRSWSDRLETAAVAEFGEAEAIEKLRRLRPFPAAYQARTGIGQAIADLRRIEAVRAGSPLEVSLHPPAEGGARGLRLYRASEPVVLSDVLPILENLGLRVVAEEPFRIDCADGETVWIDEFQLAGATAAAEPSERARERFEDALVAIWTGRVENDGFNRLILAAGISARQAALLRLYAKVLRQAGTAFSQAYMEDALGGHPALARRLVRLFEIRFDPDSTLDRSLAAVAEIQAIDHALDAVASLDEDRILRSYLTLVLKTVRTNYYQMLPSGGPKPYVTVKLASSTLDLLPLPRPLFEIYVYSPRVEGVHMRAGKVARGGIRWSDRKEDFRTEILGLMKAQTVKNAVIVPVGAKGGFVVKRPPPARDQLGAEGVECYKILIRGLLDLTDNIVADSAAESAGGGHRIVPPPRVVRHDGDDPYLVVAADKGTAAFSDYANAIAEEYGFWLGDAFASGGSAGYDHKGMGITARGAWELVKRHFRELGRDIETSDPTVVGVGDMSGDVFGNGMLMSRRLRLVGAFDHRHVFVDPDPDPGAGLCRARAAVSVAAFELGRLQRGADLTRRRRLRPRRQIGAGQRRDEAPFRDRGRSAHTRRADPQIARRAGRSPLVRRHRHFCKGAAGAARRNRRPRQRRAAHRQHRGPGKGGGRGRQSRGDRARPHRLCARRRPHRHRRDRQFCGSRYLGSRGQPQDPDRPRDRHRRVVGRGTPAAAACHDRRGRGPRVARQLSAGRSAVGCRGARRRFPRPAGAADPRARTGGPPRPGARVSSRRRGAGGLVRRSIAG